MMSISNTAQSLLKRAVEYDQKKRYVEAKVCYMEGISLLLETMKVESNGELKRRIQEKVSQYLNRAEELQRTITEEKSRGTYREQFKIENDSTGNSYETLFGKFLNQDGEVTKAIVEDPYIRSHHQCQNFLRLCELFVKRCKDLKQIELVTTRDSSQNGNQYAHLSGIKKSLQTYGVHLEITFSETLHDRQIILSTGWVIKIGRGLDFFKPPQEKFSLGLFDLDLRPCTETTVDIFHSKQITQNR